MFKATDSIHLVEQVISDTILQKGAEDLYDKYLAPKTRPYTAMHSLESIKKTLEVSWFVYSEKF